MLNLVVPIELPNGEHVDNRNSFDTWKPAAKGLVDAGEAGDPVTWAELLTEAHHSAYGRPWIVGRLYLEQFLRVGLAPSSRLLDVGCGAGRLGVHVIPYLGVGAYAGFDAHLRSLVAFSAYEIRLHGLAEKAPRLLLTHDFSVESLGQDFDFVADLSVLRLLPVEVGEVGYRQACAALKPGGRYVCWGEPTIGIDGMKLLGMRLEHRELVVYPELAGLAKAKARSDDWLIFVREQIA